MQPSAEAVLVGAEQRGDDDVATGLDAPVDPKAHPPAQLVDAQGLLRLREADFPGHPGVLDGGQRAGSRPAIHTGDVHDVGQALHHAGGDRANARLGDQLDGNRSQRIHLLEVIDQLREILDGIDVVVWRRRDQRDPLLGMPEARDLGGRFVTGQLATFARLRPLRHLDLELIGKDAVLGRDAEAS